MIRIVLISCLLILFIHTATTTETSSDTTAPPDQPRSPPHVVIVVVDDVGTADMSFSAFSGSPIPTPFLNRLANDSLRLRTYYAHPTCTPTRAALLTGRYAHNVGLPFPLIGNPLGGLDVSVPVLPELLRERGYATHMVGKWHLGHSKKSFSPLRRGFDTFYGLHGGGFDHYSKSTISRNIVDLWDGDRRLTPAEVDLTVHATELFTDRAVRVIRDHAAEARTPRRPMFLYLAYTAAHDPLQADSEHVEACAHISSRTRRLFCAMMHQLDSGVERVRRELVEAGMWDNTLFLFTSDNGGMPLCGGFNYPFRGTKSMAWEGGVRVPGFIHAPAHLGWRAGDYHGLVHVADWLPTILSITDGADAFSGDGSPSTTTSSTSLPPSLDGIDLSRSLATQGQSPRKNAVLQQDIFLNSTAFRSGCLKLLLGCPGQPTLYKEPVTSSLYHVDAMDKPVLGSGSGSGSGDEGCGCGGSFQFRVVQFLTDMVEYLVDPPVDQFYKYMIGVQFSKLNDLLHGTSFTNFLTSYQLSSTTASLQSMPPTLEWQQSKSSSSPAPPARGGPFRVMLFDLCQDPSERHNLAYERPHDVERLYDELSATFRGSPLQLAGDVLDDDAPSGSDSGPWLADDAPVVVENRKRMFAKFESALWWTTASAIAVVSIFITICCCCCRSRRVKEKKE